MKTYQPLQISTITRNYTWQNKNCLAIASLLGFPLSGGRPLLEQDLWSRLGKAMGDSVLDLGIPKANGELLLYGNFHAPGGEAVTAGRAVLQCGKIDKELAVIGNRYWRTLIGPTEPEPFTSMPLTYELAFGGPKYKFNNLGKGIEEVDVDGEQRVPLPNIEYPDKLVTSSGDRPEPAGFSSLDVMWDQRLKRAGTYDDKWVQEVAPAYPLDIDWNYFNAAPKDQWLDGFWLGDETYSLYNVHPEKPVLQGNLPGFRSRSFIVPKDSENLTLKEVEQRLETVLFFPEQDMGVLLWRGVVDVVEDDLSDMHALVVAFEDAGLAPKSLQHYQQAFDNREDPDLQLKYVNNTEDLIPDRVPCGYRYVTLTEDDVNMPMLENIFAGAEEMKNELIATATQQKEKARQQLESITDRLPPEVAKEKMAELNKPIEFQKFEVPSKAERLKMMEEERLRERVDFSKIEENIKSQVQEGKDLTKQNLQKTYDDMKSMGVDENQLARITEAMKQIDLPPVLPRPYLDDMRQELDKQLANIEKQKQDIINSGGDAAYFPEIGVDFDALFTRFKQLEAMQKEAYRLSAHNSDNGRHPHRHTLDEVRDELLQAYKNGEILKDRDFACIDLSNQDLTGIDLEGAYLEQVNFSGAVLDNAKLGGAIIARANLSGASLRGAVLDKANLGKASFSDAKLDKTSLKETILEEGVFKNTSLTDCDLSNARIAGARFNEVDFSNSIMNAFNVDEQDLSKCKFDHCELNDSVFTKCQLHQSSFTHASMHKASFSECQGEHADFSQANLENARFHEGCVLNHANFSASELKLAVFQYASLEDTKFDEAKFLMADFSNSNLQRASFHRAIGKKSQFAKSDLGLAKMTSMNMMEGVLYKARITSADFSNSNLYSVDFMHATVGGTNFSGAILDMTQFQDWTP